MIRTVLALVALAVPAVAAAQGFPSALELGPDERGFAEARLGGILDRSGPNEVTGFTLPSGRTMTVRTYPAVRRPGEAPCRGYRIDLEGSDGGMAVDGFRCRVPGSGRWVIVEPETVLARSVARPSFADTVTAALDRTTAAPSPATVPVPRRVPERPTPPQIAALPEENAVTEPVEAVVEPRDEPPAATVERLWPETDGTGVADRVRAVLEPDGSIADAEPEASEPDEPSADEPLDAAADDGPDVADPIDPVEPDPDSSADRVPEQPRETVTEPDAAEDVVAAVEPQPARLVEEEAPDASEPDNAYADERILAALEDLNYLATGSATDAAITAAVDEFAADERITLPIAPDALLDELEAALDRSFGVASCPTDAAPSEVCIEPAD